MASRAEIIRAANNYRANDWRYTGPPPSNRLAGLGDNDPPQTIRRTFVSRHDLPNYGPYEVPAIEGRAAGIGGAGTGPNNGIAGQIIRPGRYIASPHLGGFWTATMTPGNRRWQRWQTLPAPGYRWCYECDRTIPATAARQLCPDCAAAGYPEPTTPTAPPPD